MYVRINVCNASLMVEKVFCWYMKGNGDPEHKKLCVCLFQYVYHPVESMMANIATIKHT